MRVWTYFAIALLTVLAAGCGSDPQGLSAIAWVDGTGSAKGDSIAMCTERARAVTAQVARKQGTAIVERLDSSTANAPTFRATKKFSVPAEIASDPALIRKKQQDDIDAMYATAAPQLAAPAAGHTEIVGALTASGAKLRDYTGDRFVFVCSDLLDRRLLKLDAIDRPNVERLLERMRVAGEIPQLHGAQVALDTTSAIARDDLGPSEQAAMEFFYSVLIEEGGGQLIAYGTGVDLPLE